MTTTTLTPTDMQAPKEHRHFLRDTVGWNRRATIYYSTVAAICIVLGRVHP